MTDRKIAPQFPGRSFGGEEKKGKYGNADHAMLLFPFAQWGLKKGCPKAKLDSAVFSVIMSLPHEYITP